MSNALTQHEAQGTAVSDVTAGVAMQMGQVGSFVASLEAHWRLANMLVRSGMLPKALNTPDAAMAVMLKAHEIGIPYMYAFANLHYFDGKLVESAALMVGMATERCGVTYEVIEWTEERCELLFHRPGWKKPMPSVFTMEDAKRAKLTGKDNWQKYPKGMLLARAQSQGVRAIAPDRFGGMYSVEEVRDFEVRQTPEDQGLAVLAALHADDEPEAKPAARAPQQQEAGPVEDAEVIDIAGEEVPAESGYTPPAKLASHHEKYVAALKERQMDGDADRLAFQERIHKQGLTGSLEWDGWARQDYLEALTEVTAIKLPEVDDA